MKKLSLLFELTYGKLSVSVVLQLSLTKSEQTVFPRDQYYFHIVALQKSLLHDSRDSFSPFFFFTCLIHFFFLAHVTSL